MRYVSDILAHFTGGKKNRFNEKKILKCVTLMFTG